MRIKFEVSIELPHAATEEDVETYVIDALGSWCDGLRPPLATGNDDDGDPMWGSGDDFIVKRIKE